MAINNRATAKQIDTIVSQYVDGNKIAQDYVPSTGEFTNILDKIGRQVLLYSGSFYDLLPELDGEFLPLGKITEEVKSDLKKPIDYNSEGTTAMARRKQGFRPTWYSYPQKRLVIPNSIPYNVYEQASISQAGFISLVQDNIKTFNDSIALAKYGRKKKLMNLVASEIKSVMSGERGSLEIGNDIVVGNVIENGKYYMWDGDTTSIYVGMEDYTLVAGDTVSPDVLINKGIIVKLDLQTTLAKPTDEETGTAFVKALKNLAEDLKFPRDSRSLSGATIGSDTGVTMYLRRGIASVIDTEVLAGAFHQDKVSVPISFKVVDDDCLPAGVYALLVDPRMIKLHPTYMAIRQNENGEGDFVNQFSHTDYTAFYSKNTYCHIFVEPTE